MSRKIFWGSFHNSGQICAAIKRVYIHEDIYEDVRNELVSYAGAVRVGNPFEDGVGVGPVQNSQQYAKVKCVRTILPSAIVYWTII